MSEPMTVRPAVYPIAADTAGLWLISGTGPWQSRLSVMADGDVRAEVELTLSANGVALGDVVAIYSTGWHPAGPAVVPIFVAIVREQDDVAVRWPDATLIGAFMPEPV